MVEMLLDRGARCDVISKLGEAPVIKAATHGHNKTYQRLYKASWAETYGEIQLQVPVRDYDELREEFDFLKSLPLKSLDPANQKETAAPKVRSREAKTDGRVFWKQKGLAPESESEEELDPEPSEESEDPYNPWPKPSAREDKAFRELIIGAINTIKNHSAFAGEQQ
mmetsp:Transcript_41105/g.64208  ORF Transcript_41105/g.64208 Transcript_41105/m.64208 type:complete len:167 (-) Transcript_41105:62-562(-)